MKLSVIVPCFNEADNVSKLHAELLPVVAHMLRQGPQDVADEILSAEMIFVDDGSSDGTLPALQACFGRLDQPGIAVKIVSHPANLGLGAAIRTGFSQAEGDVVVTVDSDGTYRFTEIPALLALLAGGVDIVTASPYHPDGGVVGVPAYRLLLSKGSSFIYRLLVNWQVHTYTCLFRAYRAEVIQAIPFNANGFLAGTELLVKAMLKGYRVAEFPAVLHTRMYGISKAKIAQTIRAHLEFQAWVLGYRLRSAFPLPKGDG